MFLWAVYVKCPVFYTPGPCIFRPKFGSEMRDGDAPLVIPGLG
jgi:hypothetical protein